MQPNVVLFCCPNRPDVVRTPRPASGTLRLGDAHFAQLAVEPTVAVCGRRRGTSTPKSKLDLFISENPKESLKISPHGYGSEEV